MKTKLCTSIIFYKQFLAQLVTEVSGGGVAVSKNWHTSDLQRVPLGTKRRGASA